MENRNCPECGKIHELLPPMPLDGVIEKTPSKYSKEIGESASKNGKEVIIHLPMESHEPIEKEEKILLKENMNRKNVANLLSISSQELKMAKGLSSHMGSKATENAILTIASIASKATVQNDC